MKNYWRIQIWSIAKEEIINEYEISDGKNWFEKIKPIQEGEKQFIDFF